MRIEFRDLHKLARERTRDAAGTVLQLLDSNEECTAMLLACAIDFVEGAGMSIKEATDEKLDDDQAKVIALTMLIASFDKRTLLATFKKLKETRL